jgi:hypothetical protein
MNMLDLGFFSFAFSWNCADYAMWPTRSTDGVLRTSGRDPLNAPDFFHAVSRQFQGIWISKNLGRKAPRYRHDPKPR